MVIYFNKNNIILNLNCHSNDDADGRTSLYIFPFGKTNL